MLCLGRTLRETEHGHHARGLFLLQTMQVNLRAATLLDFQGSPEVIRMVVGAN